MTDFETWLLDFDDRVYRYWIYRRMFTPYEQKQCFMDESVYVDTCASKGIIEEAVELPDGDVLLGFRDPDDDSFEHIAGNLKYYKLSEIDLAYFPCDQPNFYVDEGGACDFCGSPIDKHTSFDLSLASSTNDVPGLDKRICKDCTASILHTVRGIQSGGADDPCYEITHELAEEDE